MKVCIIGASGKLGRYMVRHALDRGYEVVGVCREKSVVKLDAFKGRITIIPGATNDREVIERAVSGCDGVLTVLVPWGVHDYSSGTAQAVLDFARPGARLIFSCGWHITRDGQDKYSRTLRIQEKFAVWIGRLTRLIDLRQRHAVDGRARERSRRRRKPGPARLEPARGRSHPREQHDAPRGLRPLHGRGPQ
jgi:hypothetical protein